MALDTAKDSAQDNQAKPAPADKSPDVSAAVPSQPPKPQPAGDRAVNQAGAVANTSETPLGPENPTKAAPRTAAAGAPATTVTEPKKLPAAPKAAQPAIQATPVPASPAGSVVKSPTTESGTAVRPTAAAVKPAAASTGAPGVAAVVASQPPKPAAEKAVNQAAVANKSAGTATGSENPPKAAPRPAAEDAPRTTVTEPNKLPDAPKVVQPAVQAAPVPATPVGPVANSPTAANSSTLRPAVAAVKPAAPSAGAPAKATSVASPASQSPVTAPKSEPGTRAPVQAPAKPAATVPAKAAPAKPATTTKAIGPATGKAPVGKSQPIIPAKRADPVARPMKPPVMNRPLIDNSVDRAIKLAKSRNRRMIFGSLAFFVFLPTLLAAIYYAFIASDQYVAQAKFAVRGESAPTADVLGFLSGNVSGVQTSDSYILQDYIASRSMVEALQKKIDVRGYYARKNVDFVARKDADVPIEEFIKYWKSMVKLEFDQQTGIITLEARAFEAADALSIANAIVIEGTSLINRLSDSARQDTLALSKAELKNAEDRLAKARLALTAFRGSSNTFDPTERAKFLEGRISALQDKITTEETRLASLKGFVSDKAPSYRVIVSNIDALKAQLAAEQAKINDPSAEAPLSSGAEPTGLTTQLDSYQELQIEAEFSEKFYVGALEAMLRADIEAKRKSRYLAVFVEPTLAEEAVYPLRVTNTLLVMVTALFAWAIGALVYAAIKDHVV